MSSDVCFLSLTLPYHPSFLLSYSGIIMYTFSIVTWTNKQNKTNAENTEAMDHSNTERKLDDSSDNDACLSCEWNETCDEDGECVEVDMDELDKEGYEDEDSDEDKDGPSDEDSGACDDCEWDETCDDDGECVQVDLGDLEKDGDSDEDSDWD